jgi:hypothetical protein
MLAHKNNHVARPKTDRLVVDSGSAPTEQYLGEVFENCPLP